MLELLITLIIFSATTVGAIAGIGGGIIIKPTMDFVGLYEVSQINLISGLAVLSMSMSNAVMKKISAPQEKLFKKETLAIAIGSAIGGLTGKKLFRGMIMMAGESSSSIIQTTILIVLNLYILIKIFKPSYSTQKLKNNIGIFCLGTGVGTISSFLGIGGGPINISLLQYFMHLNIKDAANYSLIMILFTQFSYALFSFTDYRNLILGNHFVVLYVIAGIAGGALGRVIHKKISEEFAKKIYIVLVLSIIAIVLATMVKYFIK